MSIDLFYMQMISMGLILLAAHYGSRITHRLRLGEMVGQVLGGLLVGPVLLLLIEHRYPVYREALHSLHFFTFVFLSMIAFGVGDELTLSKLRSSGKEALIISICEALFTWLLISSTFILMGCKLHVALIIGTIGIATAPAATFTIMNKLNIAGKMRATLGGMVVIDDVIEIIFFSIACQSALLLQRNGSVSVGELIPPIGKELAYAVLLGAGIFLLLRLCVERRWLYPKKADQNGHGLPGPEFLSRLISEMPGPSVNVFILVAGCVCVGVGLALHFHLPFLITAVTAGVLIANFYSRQVFHSLQIESATSLFTLFFFALLGANADLEAFKVENIAYVAAYIASRSIGKMGGTWIGCRMAGTDKRLRSLLPRLMLPQAGVAAVEAFYVASVLGADGQFILGIILPGLIFFEIVGVLVSERALLKWRSWMSGGGDLIDMDDMLKERLSHDQFRLAQVLDPESIVTPMKATGEGDATWQLLHRLHVARKIENPGQVLDIIMERERQGGITLGDGIAILHGRVPGQVKPVVALGVLPKGHSIICGGPSEEPVDIIYLVVSPVTPPMIHLEVLSAIARFLLPKENRAKLRAAPDPESIMDLMPTLQPLTGGEPLEHPEQEI